MYRFTYLVIEPTNGVAKRNIENNEVVSSLGIKKYGKGCVIFVLSFKTKDIILRKYVYTTT